MRIGIIGAGQLGRMLALAGYPLGSRFCFLDHSAEAPGAQVGDIVLGAFDDRARLAELAAQVDVMTFDVENVPADVLAEIAAQVPFLPPVAALAAAQDRLHEKELFERLDIPTPRWRIADDRPALEAALQHIGLPAVVKTRRLGYDGRGQHLVREAHDMEAAWQLFGGQALIVEEFVAFDCEVSIIGARSTRGETVAYPLTRNVHAEGILRHSLAPAVFPALQREASAMLRRIMENFDYAGILTIEFFVADGRLLANEIAPRVHNSGHWTIEGAVTSQFENHIRAIRGLPLGDPGARGFSAMVNFLGELPSLESVLAVPGTHYHDYGKSPRPMRKLGHCTTNAATAAGRDQALQQLLKLVR